MHGIVELHELPSILDAISLLQGSPSWGQADEARMQQWAGDYLEWLETSKFGKNVASNMSPANIGTWYWAQVASLALFTGDTVKARRVVELAKTRLIDGHITSEGVQLQEIQRSKSFHYSMFNLRGLFVLGLVGEKVGVDLFNYTAPNGGSIRTALDLVARYADPTKIWPYKEIQPDRAVLMDQLLPLLKRANGVKIYSGAYQSTIQKYLKSEIKVHRSKIYYEK